MQRVALIVIVFLLVGCDFNLGKNCASPHDAYAAANRFIRSELQTTASYQLASYSKSKVDEYARCRFSVETVIESINGGGVYLEENAIIKIEYSKNLGGWRLIEIDVK
ncbi:hypothetical protein E8K88_16345 [Lampropedia aestuarii]|uniref:Lipoprotein n=1 Tax=Lampropedia aestuarii TaxID=2562762 RepID=A0A4S5BN09_9BURK|nr:hypothetical protein [Lampropedia aestuarii]THJ30936.1 hypothetical protein E8K88_16345 [Lampropedia aestuarii]